MLPHVIKEPLRRHLDKVKKIHETDLSNGFGGVYLPDALEKKYPNAAKEWRWQYVFPANEFSTDTRSGNKQRHHEGEWVLQRLVREARVKAGLAKHISCHTFRHSFAPSGYLRDTHVLQQGGKGVHSPTDLLIL